MEKEYIKRRIFLDKVFGKMDKEYNGAINQNKIKIKQKKINKIIKKNIN